MYARPDSLFSQVAYVTNDIHAAAAMLAAQYSVPGFFVFSNVQSGVTPMGGAELRIGLARVGGVEIELIEPIGDTAPLFSDALSGGAALELRLHHLCWRVDGPLENWLTHEASIDRAVHPVVFEGGIGDEMRFFYTDEREHLGHYLEHVWMSPTMLAQVIEATPAYPQPGPLTPA